MPIRVNIDEVRGLIEMVFTGEVTTAELIETMDRYIPSSSALLPLGLFDASGVTVTDLSAEVLREMARRASAYIDSRVTHGKLAIVATGEVSTALGRIYEILRRQSPVEVRVFEERRAADSWLRIMDEDSETAE